MSTTSAAKTLRVIGVQPDVAAEIAHLAGLPDAVDIAATAISRLTAADMGPNIAPPTVAALTFTGGIDAPLHVGDLVTLPFDMALHVGTQAFNVVQVIATPVSGSDGYVLAALSDGPCEPFCDLRRKSGWTRCRHGRASTTAQEPTP